MFRNGSLRRAFVVGVGAFFLTVLVGFGSQSFLERVSSLAVAFLMLAAVILAGVLFDMVGVAAAAARKAPLNARAAKKVFGARQAVRLVANADRVASFCNDVVGDICATISGAIGALIAFRLVAAYPALNAVLVQTVMMALISALTVGGKAGVKRFAIQEAEEIIFRAGVFLAWLRKAFSLGERRGGRRWEF